MDLAVHNLAQYYFSAGCFEISTFIFSMILILTYKRKKHTLEEVNNINCENTCKREIAKTLDERKCQEFNTKLEKCKNIYPLGTYDDMRKDLCA